MADADVLTAGLRANPIVYADSQLIPYSRYSRGRPGGPTQYDANISHPVDLSGKRQARTAVAVRAKRVLEAQYQDAVRLQIDGLASAFLDVLAAVENVRFARASVAGLDQVLDVTRRLRRRGVVGPDDVDRIEIQREAAAIGQDDAEEALRRAKRSLAVLLNLPPDRADDLRCAGSSTTPTRRPPRSRPWSASPWKPGPTWSPTGSACTGPRPTCGWPGPTGSRTSTSSISRTRSRTSARTA